MSDYDEENESEARSDTSEQERDYNSDVDSYLGDAQEVSDKYNDLLMDKARLIILFNQGNLSVKDYFIELARINREINENEYDRDFVERKLIEKEIELNILLTEYENKIRELTSGLSEKEKNESDLEKGSFYRKKINILTDEQIEALNNIKEQIEALKNSSKLIEEDDEPLPSNRLYDEWSFLSNQEKQRLESLTKTKYPVFNDFKNEKNPRAAFEKAQDEFIDDVSIFLPGYWEPYIQKEMKEIKSAIKSRKELPGYIYTTGVRKLGGVYEKVEFKSMKEKFDEIKQKIKELPIQLTEDEEKETKRYRLYNKLLNKLTKEELISCMINVKNIKPEGAKMMRQDIIPLSSIIKRESGKQIPLKQIIAGRESSKRKLIKSLSSIKNPILQNYVKEDGTVVNNASYKVDLLEGYIFRITQNSSPKNYYDKIKDILFIFDYYPDFKLKFLQGEINIYQLALFEKILTRQDIQGYYPSTVTVSVYPTTVKNRKAAIQKLIETIYFATYNLPRMRKSEILTKYLITNKSKELERFVFDLAENERDYLFKIKKLLEYARKHNNEILVITTEQASVLFRKGIEVNLQTTLDYSHLGYNEVHALLLQEQYRLKELEKKRLILQAKNYQYNYVIFWKLPDIATQTEKDRWNEVLQKVNTTVNQKLLSTYINELNEQRSYLIKKYKLDFVPGLTEINKSITNIQEKLEVLEQSRIKLEIEEHTRLKELNPPQPMIPSVEEISVNYFNEFTIGQLVQSIKRKLIKLNVKLVELYDINELNNKTTVKHGGKEVRTIPKEVYTKIKDYILNEINKANVNFTNVNRIALEKAIIEVSEAKGIPVEITTADAAIKQLFKNWNDTPANIKDIYGENVFDKVKRIVNPFDFYDNETIREYSSLVKKFTPVQTEARTLPQALFDGEWYSVQYLDKDWGTGEPLKMYKKELEKNPKTQMYEVVNKITVRKGRFPFILRKLRTEQEGKFKEVWTEVTPAQVKYKVVNFGKKKIKVKRNGKGKGN